MKYFLYSICITITSFNIILSSFQTSFFKQINKDYIHQNLVISPLSVYQALSLTSNGAKDKTLEEILTTLNSNNTEELNEINLSILNAFNDFTSIEISNAIISNFTPEVKFLNMAYIYNSSVEIIKGTILEQQIKQINKWCENKTHGKITKIIDSLDKETMMLLLNVIYFKGEWSKKFNPYYTSKHFFNNFGNKNQSVQIDMMYTKEKFNYYEDNFTQIIEMPFQKDSISAFVFLPKYDCNINDFIAELDDEKLNNYYTQMNYEEVSLHIPKFELESNYIFNHALKKLGIKKVFDELRANLSGIKKENDIYIKEILQKTYLKVDENGAEAIVVNCAKSNKKIAKLPKYKSMLIDKPFLIIFRNKNILKNYDALFMAKIEKLK